MPSGNRYIRIATILNELDRSDAALIRFIEELVDILVQKNVILYTEIPGTLYKCVFTRRKLRYELKVLELTEKLLEE